MSQREGRWKSDAIKAYTRDKIQYSKRVSREVVLAREVKETVVERESRMEETICSILSTVVSHYLGAGGVEWYCTIRRLGKPRRL